MRDAVAARGTVMVQAPGDRRRWVAVRASVRGELQVGTPPPRRGLLRRPDAGERRRLEGLGFVFVVDTLEAPTDEPAHAVELMQAALGEVGGAERVLLHPGVGEGIERPAPQAPREAHLAALVASLVEAGRGRASADAGRPARARAWAFTHPDEGTVSVEDVDARRDPVAVLPLARGATEQAARHLAAVLDGEGARPQDPLFLSLYGL